MHILLTKTALGRSIYCVGGNPEGSSSVGINSANVLTFCYTLSVSRQLWLVSYPSVVPVSAALTLFSRTIPTQSQPASSAAHHSWAAKGTMVGTMLGALIIAVLRNGFSLLSVSSAVQNLMLGLVIIGAVLLDVTRERMAAGLAVWLLSNQPAHIKQKESL